MLYAHKLVLKRQHVQKIFVYSIPLRSASTPTFSSLTGDNEAVCNKFNYCHLVVVSSYSGACPIHLNWQTIYSQDYLNLYLYTCTIPVTKCLRRLHSSKNTFWITETDKQKLCVFWMLYWGKGEWDRGLWHYTKKKKIYSKLSNVSTSVKVMKTWASEEAEGELDFSLSH